MAAPYNLGAQFRVMIGGTISGGPVWSNVYQFMLVSGATPLTFADVVEDFDDVATQIGQMFDTWQSTLWTWDRFSVSELDDSVVSGVQGMTVPVSGLRDEPLLPTQTTFQLAFPTNRSRRILKKALPAFCEDNTLAGTGTWDPTMVTNVLTAAQLLLLPLEAEHAAWQYSYNNKSGDPDEIVFPISVRATTTPKVQRRRRIGSGA